MGAGRAAQELDAALVRIAASRLDWSGWSGPATTIRQGDSLRDDQFVEGRGPHGAALVLCDPPTGVKDWGYEQLGYDPRWEFGLPPRSEPELAWLQHCRERLRKIEGDWWHQFRDEPAITAKVPVIELLDDDVDLTPSRHLQRTAEDVATDHARALAELAPLLQALPRRLPGQPARTTPVPGVPMVSIAELVRAGAVHLLLDRDMPNVDMRLQPGDVLVSVSDPTDPPLVVTAQRGEPTPDRHLLRCDPDVLDPYFLAGFLRSKANTRRAVTGSGVFRYDVRRAHIPRLPLAGQRRYGQAFRRLADFADLLHRAAALGDDAVRLAVDGLTSGVFIPSTDPQMKGD